MAKNSPNDRKAPVDYEPYPTLEIGKGKLVNVRFLIQVGNHYPLLIGRGKYPLVWIGALAQPENNWILLVERNVARQYSVAVNLFEDSERGVTVPTVEVKVGGTVILRVIGYGYDLARIEQLDLRPIGFSVHLDLEGVHVGGMTVGSLNVTNAEAVFAFA